MNPVTPEQLAAAHQADVESFAEFQRHADSLKDEKYRHLWGKWREANEYSHRLQSLFDAQKLLSEQQPQP